MNAIINERQLTPEQEEEIELRQVEPRKFEPEFDPEIEFRLNKKAADPKKNTGYRTYTREEVAALIAASEAPFEPPPPVERQDYPTYSREQVQELMREHYEYIDREKKKKEERAKWDSPKTTESETKTASTTKRSKRTKD